MKSLKSKKKNTFSSNHLKITKIILFLSNLKSFSVGSRMCFTARTINCHFESKRLKKKNFFFVNFFVTRCFSVLAVSRFFTYRCYTHTRLWYEIYSYKHDENLFKKSLWITLSVDNLFVIDWFLKSLFVPSSMYI